MAKKTKPREMKQRKLKPGEDIFQSRGISWKKTDGKVPYLETNIDRLYKMVMERRSMSFLDAARELNVAKEQIIEWARILEEHRLAKVHYPVFGGASIIFREKEKRRMMMREPEERKKRPAGRKAPKLGIALAGGLMVFFGYVMLVTNQFTLSMRLQVTSAAGRIAGLFSFLPYPLNIMTPLGIIIVAVWAFAGLRRKGRSPGKPGRKEAKSKKVDDRLEKIRKELGP